jgi:cysteine synthase B
VGVLSAIGNTPLVELTKLSEGRPQVRILGKLEGCNPGGSVKDRPAYHMIRHAEMSGELRRGKTVIEATSGNTGIALAMICAANGYRARLFMPESVSAERRGILQALGAEIVLTPAGEGTDGAIRRAERVLEQDPDIHYNPNQFENPDNSRAHYETTGPEIWHQSAGEVDVFVAGMGTGGTLMGVAAYLRQVKQDVKIVGVEPPPGHTIQGLKNMTESIVPKIYDETALDAKLTVGDEQAFETARLLATSEGLLVGMSSGAAVAGALRVARDMISGTIVVILPDRGDRYLSTALFGVAPETCSP